MTYIRDHWRGHHPLPRAFWINFLIPFLVIAMAEPWIRPAAAGGWSAHAVTSSLYVLVTHLVILPWQIVGLWRSSRRHLKQRGDLMIVTSAQLAALVAVTTAVGATVTTVQRVTGFGLDVRTDGIAASPFRLKVLGDGRTLMIEGIFAIGISRDLQTVLTTTPGIATVILDSDGGRVFEARGVARQILANGLDTHVEVRCRSACTIAYVAGRSRTLGRDGKLGFHGYRLDGPAALVDAGREQDEDKAFFMGRGIAGDFLDHAFGTPHEEMWQPSVDRLLEAGVVHQIRPFP